MSPNNDGEVMTPVRTKYTTTILGAPRDWDDSGELGPCGGLAVVQSKGCIYSYWKPTWYERIKLLFGGNIRLTIVGSSMPPVCLDTNFP